MIGGIYSAMFPRSIPMIFNMFIPTRKQYQVFNTVISSISIYMVDMFAWFKFSSEMFFYYKTMFGNVVMSFVSAGRIYYEVSLSIFNLATLPYCFVTTNIGTSFSFGRFMSSKFFITNRTFDFFKTNSKTTFIGTKLSSIFRLPLCNIKRLFAVFTKYIFTIFNHCLMIPFRKI